MEKKEQNVRCGSCGHWKRRVDGWGYCCRYAPHPFVFGLSIDQFHRDWEKARLEKEKGGEKWDWSPPRNWRVMWPETNETDHCGDWVDSDGAIFFPHSE